MDSDLQKLEAELEALTPAPVPPSLESRIVESFEGEIEVPAEDKVIPFPIWHRLGATAAVAVACVGVFFAVLNNLDSPTGATASGGTPLAPSEVIASTGKNFVPASADNTLRSVTDGGVFINEHGRPVREVRYEFSGSYRWTDERDGSELELTIPRERSYLVPVRTD